jgi:hypothetical protein
MINNKLLLYIAVLTFLFSGILISQEEEGKNESDSAETEEIEWWNEDWENFDFEFDLFDKHKTPSISVTYGFSSINLENFSSSFADPDIPELKLGYTSEKSDREADGILDYKYNYLFLSNIRTDISNTPGVNEIESNLWRFGFGWAKGYGYDLGSSAIIPYNSYSFAWSRLDVKEFPDNQEDRDKLALYNETFRFGTGSEAGLRIQVIPQVTLEGAYERSVIFERHLFWKWAGSALIEGAGHWALDAFVDRILESSPYAAPVVSFILKSALSYGVYELRQEKMNWPFESAAPIGYDQFKFGVTFNF